MAVKYLSFNKELRDAVDLKQWLKEEPTSDQPLPLPYVWHIWEQLQQDERSRESYSENTADLASFDTVQKFWRLWSCIPQPSELVDNKRMVRQGKDGRSHVVDALMIFRDGIKPMWEDPQNAVGGHLEFRLLHSNTKAAQIDEYWNNLVLAVVGSTLEASEYITGIRLVDKLSQGRSPCIRVEVWFTKLPTQAAQESLMREVSRCMATKIDGSIGHTPRCDIRFHSK